MVTRIRQCERGCDLAVVQLAHDYRLVDIAMEELDQHLAADPRQGMAAPVGACEPLGNAHPGAARVVARGMAVIMLSSRGQSTRIGSGTALPAELDPDLMVAAGGHGGAWH